MDDSVEYKSIYNLMLLLVKILLVLKIKVNAVALLIQVKIVRRSFFLTDRKAKYEEKQNKNIGNN